MLTLFSTSLQYSLSTLVKLTPLIISILILTISTNVYFMHILSLSLIIHPVSYLSFLIAHSNALNLSIFNHFIWIAFTFKTFSYWAIFSFLSTPFLIDQFSDYSAMQMCTLVALVQLNSSWFPFAASWWQIFLTEEYDFRQWVASAVQTEEYSIGFLSWSSFIGFLQAAGGGCSIFAALTSFNQI